MRDVMPQIEQSSAEVSGIGDELVVELNGEPTAGVVKGPDPAVWGEQPVPGVAVDADGNELVVKGPDEEHWAAHRAASGMDEPLGARAEDLPQPEPGASQSLTSAG